MAVWRSRLWAPPESPGWRRLPRPRGRGGSCLLTTNRIRLVAPQPRLRTAGRSACENRVTTAFLSPTTTHTHQRKELASSQSCVLRPNEVALAVALIFHLAWSCKRKGDHVFIKPEHVNQSHNKGYDVLFSKVIMSHWQRRERMWASDSFLTLSDDPVISPCMLSSLKQDILDKTSF